jgi:cholesterol oxidase
LVADGSILPTAVGLNPLLTIAALAERIAALSNLHTSLDLTPLAFDPTTYVAPMAPVGLEFTETMQGYVNEGDYEDTLEDFRQAARQGRSQWNGLRMWLWVYIESVDGFIQDEGHVARLKGYIEYPPIGGKRTVERVRLQFLVRDPQMQTKQMRFSLPVTGADGQPYFPDEVKAIQDDPGQDVWRDTTRLFTFVYRGTSTDHPLLSRGIMRVSWADFLQQLASFRVHHAATREAKQLALQTFGDFFFGELWAPYGKPHTPQG